MEHLELFESFNKKLILYHGSCSMFDKFDISKLRMGGSQTTYGYGIYMTDSKGYAESYIKGENGIVCEEGGYLYEVKITNANFLNFGENINGTIKHNKIDSKNYTLIKNQLEKENIALIDSEEEPTEININDLVWTVYDKIFRSFYENLTVSEQIKHGDFKAKKMSSEFLVRCGVDGMKYPLETSSKISTSYGYEGYGYVIYHTDIIENNKIIKKY